MGKSTLINALLARKVSLSSKTPGKTRGLHMFDMPELKLSMVDCPGYGYARAGHEERENWKALMEYYFAFSKRFPSAFDSIR